ncbi:hypothetical protein ACS0TY_032671 [Phlomoides rotata]
MVDKTYWNYVCDVSINFIAITSDRLATIAGRIGYEHDLGNARKMLFEQFGVVPGLSIKDKLKASVLIGGKVEHLEIWSTLPDEAKAIYVNEVLGLKDTD